MRIRNVRIKNFAGIKNIYLNLSSNTVLLFGETGVGKTAVLDAIAVLLNASLKNIPGIDFPGIHKNDIRCENTLSNYCTPVEIEILAEIDGNRFSWMCSRSDEKVKRKNSLSYFWASEETEEVVEQIAHINDEAVCEYIGNQIAASDSILPLIYYGNAHRNYEIDEKKWKKIKKNLTKGMNVSINREHGYVDCLQYSKGEKIIERILHWLQEMNPAQKKEVKNTLLKFLSLTNNGKMSENIQYDAENIELIYTNENMQFPVRLLSNGLQSLIWMILDLTCRMAVLNPHVNRNIAEIPGVVLIDEIELHLHPQWQREIVCALRTTFPNVQFIMTTHSPQVLEKVNNGCNIYLLHKTKKRFAN